VTTIVVDQEMGYMAADRQVTTNDGEVMIACETKIERLMLGGDPYLVGLAGLEGPGLYFLEWLEHGDWDEPPEPIYDIYPEDDFSVVLLGPDGIFVADKFCRLSKIDHRWYAVGSGGQIAWAVLEAGCGIEKAMETAIKMDPSTGFGYQVRYLTDEESDWDVDP
jgi:ATP-dependent protease HslVU (ClpYQ) peptidase subunit